MTLETLTVALIAALLYALVSQLLGRYLITAPMAMVVVGALAFHFLEPLDVEGGTVHLLAEIALVLVLFHDASTVNLRSLREDPGPPLRLLLIGFPLAIVVTTGVSAWLLPGIGIYGALLLAAAVTPTDAGLGAPTVLNPSVPVRVRRMLNVESGLNDGLATPIVSFALTVLASQAGDSVPSLIDFAVAPLLLGLLVGIVGAVIVAVLVRLARSHKWASEQTVAIAVLTTPLMLFLVADLAGGNVFIAAFVGGLAFGGALAAGQDDNSSQLLETGADIVGWLVWFFAGGLGIEFLLHGLTWQAVVLAVLALTVLRIGPVALCLVGTHFNWRTVLFVGWFGPRGLATVVFSLLILEELGEENPVVAPVLGPLVVAVFISVFAHGFSATPLAERYGRWVSANSPTAETRTVTEPNARGRLWAGIRSK